MNILIHPTYFPSIATFCAIAQASHVKLETQDNFVKQTYRNRCFIYGANGRLLLNVPVVYSQNNRQLYKAVPVFNDEKWQLQHWKSLESAYRTSPFFEFYEDELKPLFFETVTSLMDFNVKCLERLCECLQLDVPISFSSTYEKVPEGVLDLRPLVNAKREPIHQLAPYTQVFSPKHGYISNLSILDLLFNEGPNALNYLESQTITPL